MDGWGKTFLGIITKVDDSLHSMKTGGNFYLVTITHYVFMSFFSGQNVSL